MSRGRCVLGAWLGFVLVELGQPGAALAACLPEECPPLPTCESTSSGAPLAEPFDPGALGGLSENFESGDIPEGWIERDQARSCMWPGPAYGANETTATAHESLWALSLSAVPSSFAQVRTRLERELEPPACADAHSPRCGQAWRFDAHVHVPNDLSMFGEAGPDLELRRTQDHVRTRAWVRYSFPPTFEEDPPVDQYRIWQVQSGGQWQTIATSEDVSFSPGQWYRVTLEADFFAGTYTRLRIAGQGEDVVIDLGGYPLDSEPSVENDGFHAAVASENSCAWGYPHTVIYDDLSVRPVERLANQMKDWLLTHAPCKHYQPGTGQQYDPNPDPNLDPSPRTPGAACEALRALATYHAYVPDYPHAGGDPRPELKDKIAALANWVVGLQHDTLSEKHHGAYLSTPPLSTENDPENEYYYSIDAALCGNALLDAYELFSGDPQADVYLESAIDAALFIRRMQNPRDPNDPSYEPIVHDYLTWDDNDNPEFFGGVMEYFVVYANGPQSYDNSMHTKLLLAVPFLRRLSQLGLPNSSDYDDWAGDIQDHLQRGLDDGYEFFAPNHFWSQPGDPYDWQRVGDTHVYEDTMAYAIRSLHQDIALTGDASALPDLRDAYEFYNGCTHGNPDYDPAIAWTGYLIPDPPSCSTASDAESGKLYYDLSGAGILGAFRLDEYPADAATSYDALLAHPVESLYWATGFDWGMSVNAPGPLTVDEAIWQWQDSNAVANLLEFLVAVCPEGFADLGDGCEAIDCGVPSSPDEGEVRFHSTSLDSVARYTCNPGFTLVGDASQTCGTDGNWNGTAPSCVACNLSGQWDALPDILEGNGWYHDDGRFAQDPLDGTLWYAYTRWQSPSSGEASIGYFDEFGDYVEDELVFFGNLSEAAGLEFDASGRLWVAIADDRQTYLHSRAPDGTWSTLDFAAEEPGESVTGGARAMVIDGEGVWVVADACQGPSETEADLPASLVAWRWDILDQSLSRVVEPLVMTGIMNDGTPLNGSNQGQVSCRRSYLSQASIGPSGALWVFGGTGSWDDPNDPSDDDEIRSEAFVFRGGLDGLTKILSHRPASVHDSKSSFDDGAFGPNGELYLTHNWRPAPGADFDGELLELPLAALDPANLSLLDTLGLGLSGTAQARGFTYHRPSGSSMLVGSQTDSGFHGLVRTDHGLGFYATHSASPTSYFTELFSDAEGNLWVSGSAGTDGILRRQTCNPFS